MGATKTPSSERRIALPREAIASLTRHRAHQDADRDVAGPAWTDTGLVFTTKTGAPLHPSNVNRDFHQLLRGARLRKIRFHDIRHSCASLLLDQAWTSS
ncbi:tyrosine-type recombinase/integrase [Nonomuraea sp. NPDC049152]|uniref:tyrosine-type recombinase/integrase n=1 Tax=Nonomuraea sp. NPDC049152 TaxID=3154350 RepID=UPI0033E29C99